MRKVRVLYKNKPAGELTQTDHGNFIFEYYKNWVSDTSLPAISLTLPKRSEPYQSDFLFSFFYNMLPEGSNKQVVCKYNRIDREDYFGLLRITAKNDTIGAVTIEIMEISK